MLAEKGPGSVSPLGIPMLMPNAAAGQVAMAHGFKGACFGTVSACAAGAHALGIALRMVQHGDADACVAGGTESALTPLAAAAFGAMDATSQTGHLAAVRRPPRRVRDGRGRRRAGPRGGVGRPRAWRHHPRPRSWLRRHQRRVPPHRARAVGRRRRARDRRGARRRRARARPTSTT